MLLDRVRESCAEVAAGAKHVRVAGEKISNFLDSLPDLSFELPEMDAASHDVGRGEHTAAYVLTLDAINFGCGYFKYLRPYAFEGREFEGYFAVAAALKSFSLNGSMTAQRLVDLTTDDCVRIFAQDHPSIRELMEHFGAALRELGSYLLRGFDGSFVRLIEAAGGSACRLAELLIEMNYFRDVVRDAASGEEIYFLKRAQLAAADLSLAFEGCGLGRFGDLDRLTIFADNQVPHVLRTDGLLEYSSDLTERIASRTPLITGSEEEIEIRACAVHAAELILDELRVRGHEIDAMHLDYFLWNRGEARRYKVLPTHLTRSIYY